MASGVFVAREKQIPCFARNHRIMGRQRTGKRNDGCEKVLESAAAAAPETAAGEASTAAEATATSSET
jgi:hypothetical protein